MSKPSASEPGVRKPGGFHRSIVFKNLALFLAILLVAMVPLAYKYFQSSRAYEIRLLASKLEVFAERGAAFMDVEAVHSLRRPADRNTEAYRAVLGALRRLKLRSGVDNAVIMRRGADGRYHYVAAGHDGFEVGEDAHIHRLFPATYKATNDTWNRGEMMHSRLFGGRLGDREFDRFLQVNAPLKLNGRVVAILMLNKFANPVAEQVRMNTIRLFGFTAALLALGLVLFGFASARMLRLLRSLTAAAAEVSRGNLDVSIPAKRGNDEAGRLADSFEGMVEGLRQRDFIRDTFGRYISEEIVDELLNSPDGLKLGGEVREVTFLVSDLRGFTALSNRLGPDEVVEMVNRFLEPMVEIITRYRGTVDEFQGDGILAFFGAPLAAPDDPVRAVACAVGMQWALAGINEEQRARGLPELHMGIGVNTGEVIVGNIGSEKRTKYGAMGAAINMAYRIESNTVSGQVLISPETWRKTRDVVRVGEAQDLLFKGMAEPVRVYEARGVSGEYACEIPEPPPEAFADVEPPLPARIFEVEGKRVSERAARGRIERVSRNCAEASAEAAFGRGTNLMLRVAEEAGVPEIYAKVVEAKGERLTLRFTSLPEEARAHFEKLAVSAPAPRGAREGGG